MERKPNFVLTLCLVISCWQLDDSAAVFGGAWCPYKIDKLVPCRVHNGTEKYLGSNICWKSLNGSFSCTKRMRSRPKFVTTYKRVSETFYKCCPGLEGPLCQKECFNCSTIRQMESRLGYLETKINQIQVFPMRGGGADGDASSHSNKDVKNSISDDDDDDGDLEDTLTIFNDLRALERRIYQVETQLVKLKYLIDELIKMKGAIVTFSSTTTTTMAPSTEPHSNPDATPTVHFHHHREEQPTQEKTKSHGDEERTTRTTTSVTQKIIPVSSGVVGLEINLERGDIASTLNDDYGEDADLASSSTEEYADQLYAHASSLNNA